MRKLILFLAVIVAFNSVVAYADTHTVSSCTASNINSAITAATAGDTVYLDCASGTISSNVTINKAITLQGRTANYKGGSTATTLTMSGAYFELTGSGAMAAVIKDIKFTGTVSGGYFIISTASSMTGWRVTNCWFETGAYAVSTYGLLYGLIDNCRWTPVGGYNQVMVHIEEGDVAAAYARDSALGTANNIFIEDNVIVGSSSGIEWIMSQNGQGYVFRHNSITNYTLDVHGHCSSGGTREFEIYENDWYATTNYNEGIIVIRGGTGVIYNNRITTGGYTVWEPAYYLQEISQPTICNSSTGGACHCDTYPCTHQIGRGKNDALDPLYYWNNTRNGSQVNPGVPDGADVCGSGCDCGGNDLDYFVQQNRDYYSSASTAKPGYVAYTYPHPLQGGSDTTPPTVSFTTSSPQTISTDSLSISGTASDAVGVTSCKWRIGSAPDGSNGTPLTGTTSWSGTASGFAVGANTLYAGCGDAAGNWGSASITVTRRDLNTSTCTISKASLFSFSGCTLTGGTSLAAEAGICDPTDFYVWIDSADPVSSTPEDVDGLFRFSMDLSALSNASHTLRIRSRVSGTQFGRYVRLGITKSGASTCTIDSAYNDKQTKFRH